MKDFLNLINFFLISFYQIGEVSRSVINDIVGVTYCGNGDVVGSIARELENEGVELSNQKIFRLMSALNHFVKTFYKVYEQKV